MTKARVSASKRSFLFKRVSAAVNYFMILSMLFYTLIPALQVSAEEVSSAETAAPSVSEASAPASSETTVTASSETTASTEVSAPAETPASTEVSAPIETSSVSETPAAETPTVTETVTPVNETPAVTETPATETPAIEPASEPLIEPIVIEEPIVVENLTDNSVSTPAVILEPTADVSGSAAAPEQAVATSTEEVIATSTEETAVKSEEQNQEPKVVEPVVENGAKVLISEKVELGKTYVAPQNNAVTVTFTKLPENPGSLFIEEVTLTPEQVAELGALSNVAYDITSSMADGTFEYNVTLPTSTNESGVQIKYAESVAELNNDSAAVPSNDIKVDGDSVIATLNHFTIFAVVGNPANVSHMIEVGAGHTYATIQAAIDAAQSHDTIKVYPGNYNETATNRTVLAGTPQAQGPHQFGLFLPINKHSLKIMGVDKNGNEITDSNNPDLPYVTTNATNNFGYSGIWVEGEGDTIQGIKIGDNAGGNNKTIEVVADDFTLKYVRTNTSDGGSIYINDWSDSSNVVKAYHIINNSFLDGTSVDIASGAGVNGHVSHREILGNAFNLLNRGYSAISFSGTGGVAWFTHPVGGAEIKNNSFANGIQYIRARGEYDDSEFNWKSYWRDNEFDKAIIVLEDENHFGVRTYAYDTFTNVRRIGTDLKEEVSHAQDNDTILMKNGIYALDSQVRIDKAISIIGADKKEESTIITKGEMNWTSASKGNAPLISINSGDKAVVLENLTVTGAHNIALLGSGTDYGHGINVYKSSDVTLNNITLSSNAAAGMVVNGSKVEVKNITTSNNGWGGINVDLGSGVTSPAVLKVREKSSHSETGPAIWKDDNTKDVTVNDVNHQYMATLYTHDTNVTGTKYDLKGKNDKTPDTPVNLGWNIGSKSTTPNETPLDLACSTSTVYVNENNISQNWSAVEGENIKYQREVTFPSNSVNYFEAGATNYTPLTTFGGTPGIEGLWKTRVRAYIDANENNQYDNNEKASDWSNECNITFDRTAPTKPVFYSPANNLVTNVNWVDTKWNGGDDAVSGVKGYKFRYVFAPANGNPLVNWGTSRDTIAKIHSGSYGHGEGTYTMYVKVVDNSGLESAESDPLVITYDASAPVITVNPFITNDNTPRLTGTISDKAATVSIKIGAVTFPAINKGDGTWELADDAIFPALPDGTYDVIASATDTAGNVGTDSTVNELTIDTKAPTATFKHYINGVEFTGKIAYVNDVKKLSFTGEYRDAEPSSGLLKDSYVIFDAQKDGSFRFMQNGAKAYCGWRQKPNLVEGLSGTSSSVTEKVPFTNCINSLPDGEYYMSHQVYDHAARKNDTAITQFRDVLGLHFVIDKTAPTVPTDGRPNKKTLNNNDFYFTWSTSTDAFPVTYEFQSSLNPAQEGGVLTTGVWRSINTWGPLPNNTIHSTGAGDGTWYWQVRAVDSNGNKSAWSEIWNVTLKKGADLDAPIVLGATSTASTTVIVGFNEDLNGDKLKPGDFQIMCMDRDREGYKMKFTEEYPFYSIESLTEDNGLITLTLEKPLPDRMDCRLSIFREVGSVEDVSGNKFPGTDGYIDIADGIKPMITLKGASPVVITVGGAYEDAGATAYDNMDGDITENIDTTSTVNTAVVGSYAVKYDVTDGAGNKADQVTRIVNVVNREEQQPQALMSFGGGSFTPDCTRIMYACVNKKVVLVNQAITQFCALTPAQQAKLDSPCEETTGGQQQVLGIQKYAVGTLLRSKSTFKIYIVTAENVLKHIVSLKELWQYRNKPVLSVDESVIASYNQVLGAKKYADGTLVRSKNDHKIYVIINGEKVHIKTLKDLLKYFGHPILEIE